MNVIIILNYNDYATTKRYLESVKDFDSLHRIVVVDNCSSDGSYQKLKKYESDKIRIIQTSKNQGYACGNNYGVNYAFTEFGDIDNLIISNPDIEIDNETIKTLSNYIEHNDDVFGVTPVVLDAKGHVTRNFAWRKPTYPLLLIACSSILQGVLRKVFHYTRFYSKDDLKNNFCLKADILPGCFFMVRGKKWREIGGFCEETFLYFEEDILFSKATNLGYDNVVLCSKKLRHYEGVSISKSIKSYAKKEKIYRNSCIVYMRNILKAKEIHIYIYKLLHSFFLPERFIYTNLIRRRFK